MKYSAQTLDAMIDDFIEQDSIASILSYDKEMVIKELTGKSLEEWEENNLVMESLK